MKMLNRNGGYKGYHAESIFKGSRRPLSFSLSRLVLWTMLAAGVVAGLTWFLSYAKGAM